MNGERMADLRIGEYLISDIMTCVGKKSDVYLRKFERIQEKGCSFNWCAALFTALWFVYRRMWKAAAAIMGFNVVYTMVLSILENTMTADNTLIFMGAAAGLFVLSMVVFGLLGDWLYCRHINAILDEQGCRGRRAVQKTARTEAIQKAGGTSVKGVILLWAASLVLQWAIVWLISFLL